jgi:MFS transporter, PHS family, inorganic phosphate transporter
MPGAPLTVDQLLDDAPTGRFHRRAVIVSGVGFFTDAYDLFVISSVAVLVKTQWHLSTTETSWVEGSAILGAFVGAFLFGRIADLLGRRRVYAVVAAVMIAGAIASAAAPGFAWLVAARLVLGLGIGGDYPVSAVLMSEYANRKDRGRLVALVFSMQAVGLVVGPLVAITLFASGLDHGMVWRVLLGLGAAPAAAAIYLRTRMPESPRFRARTTGVSSDDMARLFGGAVGLVGASASTAEAATTGAPGAEAPRAEAPTATPVATVPPVATAPPVATGTAGLRSLLTDRRMLGLVVGTAGAWFLFDYAYYGNTLSLPAILKAVDPGASLIANLTMSLAMFLVFAVPGYALAVLWMDRVGHRRLQGLGFAVMAVAFLALGLIAPLTTVVGPFLAVFGLSYFFIEFGPNTTTFVLPSEVFPTRMRATGHGVAAGVGKLGAFIGVFLVPALQGAIGLRGMLLVAGGASVAGYLLTTRLPEPGGRSLDDVSGEDSVPIPGLSPDFQPELDVLGPAATLGNGSGDRRTGVRLAGGPVIAVAAPEEDAAAR